MQKYGYEPLLQPLICDLKYLQTNGVTVEMDKEYHTIRGAVFSVSADNYQPMDWLALANASVMVSFAVTAFYTVMK